MSVINSAAYSELRSRSLVALGSEKATRDFDVASLLTAFDTSITMTSNDERFTVDVPEAAAQQAWCADAERAHNKLVGQFVAYARLSLAGDFDPVWVAVTGYYAAFFCAQSLTALAGDLFRRLPPVPPIPGGTWRLTTTPVRGAAGWVRVRGTAVRRSSHVAVLNAASSLLSELAAVGGTDYFSATALTAGARLIKAPRLLSQFRNDVNYSLDEGPWSRRQWPSELMSISDGSELTSRLATVRASIKDEQRIELVMLLCALLATEVATDQRKVTRKPDLRDHKWRVKHCGVLKGTRLEACLSLIQP